MTIALGQHNGLIITGYNKLTILLIAMIFSFAGFSQDWVKAAPQNKKVLVDNDHFRLVEVTLLPGKTEAIHTHPEYIEYFFKSGKMVVVYPGKDPIDWKVEAGKAYSGAPEPPHSIMNAEKYPKIGRAHV